MVKRKLIQNYTSTNEYYLNRPVKVSKAQEDAYWKNRKRERDEKFVNDFYQENKYKLIPLLIIVTVITYPFIKIGEVYKYCKDKSCCTKVNPENH